MTTNEVLSFNTDIPLNKQERYAKINAHLAKADKYMRTDVRVAMQAAHQAKKLSQNFDKNKLVKSKIFIAKAYQQTGAIDTALLLINEILIETKELKNDTIKAEAYHLLGLNNQYTGSFDLAIESYHKALRLNESLGLYKSSTKQLNNIGLLYREEGEYELALEYVERCLSISREKGFKRMEFSSYGNIGYILMKQNKWDEALERLEKVLESEHSVADTVSLCTVNYLISDVKLNQKDYPAAKEFAQKALAIANHADYAVGIVFSRRVLSDVYRCEKNYEKARKVINETLNYIKSNSVNLYLEDVLNVLYNIEYETGNYKEALLIQKRLSNRRDSLNQIKTKEKISNSEYKYQLLKNEKENQLLKIKNDSSERNAILAITIAFLLLLLVILSLFAYRKSKGYSATLEKAIEKRTKELENSNLHLAKSNEELERFTYIASHDLKTPLRNIISFTSLLENQLVDHKDEKVHEYLSFIKKGGLRLNNLIIDTLEYSRLSYLGKEGKIQTIDLNTVLENVQISMANLIKETGTKVITLNSLPSIKSNHSSMVLLFQNILENSIKYNKSDTPTIQFYTKKNSEYLSLFIEDNGIGISKEYYDEVFVMFSRLHNHNEYEGSGLGLAICKKVVEKLNGKIHIQSTLNKGSIFEIRLPHDKIVEEQLSEHASVTN